MSVNTHINTKLIRQTPDVVTYYTQLHYKLMLQVSTLSGSKALHRLAVVTVALSLSNGAATCSCTCMWRTRDLKMTRQKKTHSKYYNILIEINNS